MIYLVNRDGNSSDAESSLLDNKNIFKNQYFPISGDRMMMISPLEDSSKDFRKRAVSNPKFSRASSTQGFGKRSASPWNKSLGISKVRKTEITNKFGFSEEALIRYEKIVQLMRGLSENQKSSIVCELLGKSL